MAEMSQIAGAAPAWLPKKAAQAKGVKEWQVCRQTPGGVEFLKTSRGSIAFFDNEEEAGFAASIGGRRILKDALEIDELAYVLKNITADDIKTGKILGMYDYSDAEIVKEAHYVLRLFTDGSEGHVNYEALNGDDGPESARWARGQVRRLKTFLAKYVGVTKVS